MTERFLANRAGLVALLTAVWAIVILTVTNSYPYPHIFDHGADSPVMALEMAHGENDIEAVLHRHDASDPKDRRKAAESMKKVNDFDLFFIPLYALSCWSLARVFAGKTKLLAICICAAALFDYLEDWQIYRSLWGENPEVYLPSLVKWGFLGVVFLLLSGIFVKSASAVYSLSTKRLLAVGYFIAGGLILMDVALGSLIGYSHIALGMTIFSALLIVHIVGLLGHYLAIPGIKQTFVEDFCEQRKKNAGGFATSAIKAERE
jgi:hypothetical protein